MRFAGRVSADKISQVSVGQPVSFRINGYGGQEFRGKVTRVDPSANDVTRQVEVLVNFSDASAQPKVAGLYAEGTIESSNVQALTLPESVLVKAGDKASVWRVKNNTLSQVVLQIGVRDPRTGNIEIRSGLTEGDVILRSPSASFKEGQTAELATAKPPTAAASAASSVAKGT
jgi:multidrug efflux pump subunit AcrA (membrane-fusion protein)